MTVSAEFQMAATHIPKDPGLHTALSRPPVPPSPARYAVGMSNVTGRVMLQMSHCPEDLLGAPELLLPQCSACIYGVEGGRKELRQTETDIHRERDRQTDRDVIAISK